VPAYIAMLRGVNVSGQKIVRMERLRASCDALGFRHVATYVQSGNIVFGAEQKSPSTLSKQISDTILHDFGLAVPTLVKTREEMQAVIERNPFLKEADIDVSKLHVTFLSGPHPADSLKTLQALQAKPDQFHIGRHEVYLHCPHGYGRSKLANTAIEKALAVSATTRKWKTVVTLLEMAARL
jgi:uncharacterized protein (DUF1697 family)